MEKKEVVTTIAEYSPTAAALHKLKAELEGKQYEVSNATGLALAKFHRRELVTLRTDLEKKRKEIKAPALARCKEIDAEAARITVELVALEEPIDKQIKAEEDRKEEIRLDKERVEAARKSAIVSRIDGIRDLPRRGLDAADSLELEEFIAKVEARQLGADFAEFLPDAQVAKTEAVIKLNEMLVNLKAKEAEDARVKAENEAEAARLEEQRIQQEKDVAAERERLAAEKAEQDRLNAIEQEKLAAERAELAKLRAADEERQKEAARVAAEQQAIVDKERANLRAEQEKVTRQQEEAAAAKRQEEEADAEKVRKVEAEKLEKARKAELEKAEKEAADRLNALTATHLSTLQAILDMARDTTMTAPAIVQGIIHLAELGIKKGK